MKRCLGCKRSFVADDWDCPHCSFRPEHKDGCVVLLEHDQQAPQGYDVAFFAQLAELEAGNFWFRARTRLIVWALAKYFPDARNFLEIGCGTGAVLMGLAAAFPDLELFASEPFSEGLRFAQRRVARAKYLQIDARAIPLENEFDVIGAFDVVEHIEDDEAVLTQIRQAIVPGGGLLLTVPQHPFLWSSQDVAAGHVRRYTADQLCGKLLRTGYRILRRTSFVSLLLPAMVLSRARKRGALSELDPLDELRIGSALNLGFEKLLDLERVLIRSGVSWPFGGSLLIAAAKVA